MFRSSWIASIAFGLVLVGSAALGQQSQNAILENQPIAETGKQHSSIEDQTKTDAKQKRPINITTSVVNIEASTYDLKTNENQKEDEGNIEREIRDLEAQEKMACWAKYMFWATVGSIAVSIFGIILVWRTLRATTNIGNKQLRAYVSVEVETIEDTDNTSFMPSIFNVFVSNKGQTPARIKSHFAVIDAVRRDEDFTEILRDYERETFKSSVTLGPGERMSISVKYPNIAVVTNLAATGSPIRYIAIGKVIYQDVFEKERFSEFCFECRRTEIVERRGFPTEAGMKAATTKKTTYDWVRFGEHNKAD